MTSKTLEGMARVGWASGNPMLKRHLECFPKEEAIEIDKMRHALLWLADNVSDDMVREFENRAVASRGLTGSDAVRAAISAALRAAAEAT